MFQTATYQNTIYCKNMKKYLEIVNFVLTAKRCVQLTDVTKSVPYASFRDFQKILGVVCFKRSFFLLTFD